MYACNPSTQEGRGRRIRNSKLSLLNIEFKDSLGYTRPCLSKNKQKHQTKATNQATEKSA